jgi:hypothetical protein
MELAQVVAAQVAQRQPLFNLQQAATAVLEYLAVSQVHQLLAAAAVAVVVMARLELLAQAAEQEAQIVLAQLLAQPTQAVAVVAVVR